MYKIAVIIPVYNNEKYLKNLFRSIKNQTFGFENIQIIMIDDGSDDRGIELINSYCKKYHNVLGFYLNKNSGAAGMPRNIGLKNADSKYIMFADSDDFFPKNAFETLYNEIELKGADFVTANYINTDCEGKMYKKPIFDIDKYNNFKLSIDDYDKSFYVLSSSVCNKIFRKSFIDKNNITFLEGAKAEDAHFTMSCFLESNNAYYINSVIYCYRQRNMDQKSVSFNCDKKYFDSINKTYKAIYNNFKTHNQIKFYRFVYAKNVSYILYKFIDHSILTYDEKIEVLKNMRWFYLLSKKLNVPACQKAQRMVIDEIIKQNYVEAIKYCDIIADIRSYLTKETRENMSKPDSEMYKQILLSNNDKY